MTRRAIMVDVDGVLIRHPDAAGWSAGLERDLGLSIATLREAFFAPHWEDVVYGRAALRERLAPVLAEIAPAVTCDTLIDYWFRNDAHLDDRLLRELEALRRGGVEVHLATVQEHERAAYLWNGLDLRTRFDAMHYAAALGHAKPAPEFFRAIEERTGLAPAAIFFIDDRPDNVAAARASGWSATLWTGHDTLSALIARERWDPR